MPQVLPHSSVAFPPSLPQRQAEVSEPPLTQPIVQLKQVTKTYQNGTTSLIDINLDIKKGDFLFVTGPSGSGKSTLMKLLYGEEQADQGAVWVDSLNVGMLRGDRLSLLRRRLGIVFQDYRLIPRRTVAENVALVLRAQGVPRLEIQRRLNPALKVVDLQDKAECFPEELSGGEQQRAGIARAIVGTPMLLLADEPTGNLDPENAQQVIKILQKLNSFGITVLVATHDQSLLQRSQHPVVHLQQGRLQSVVG
ncbi:MAG TPA: cell division ATP-binding protein FtsE [Candidatus Caenarcaniphilales bacterium]